MEIPRAQVIATMRRVGLHEKIPKALDCLPDPVDTVRDAELLASFGISRERLMQMLGSSP
jgi:hypothetical protein